jgi:hypothetical protein
MPADIRSTRADIYPPSRGGTDDRSIPPKEPRRDNNTGELLPPQERERRDRRDRRDRNRRDSHGSPTPEVKDRRHRNRSPSPSPSADKRDRRGNRDQRASVTNRPHRESKDSSQVEKSIRASADSKRHEGPSPTTSYQKKENTTGARQNNLPGQRSSRRSEEPSDDGDLVTAALRKERLRIECEKKYSRDDRPIHDGGKIPTGFSIGRRESDGRLVMIHKPLKQRRNPDNLAVTITRKTGEIFETDNGVANSPKHNEKKPPKDEKEKTEDARGLGDRVSSGMRKAVERVKGKGKEPEGANVENKNLEGGRHVPEEKWDYPSQGFPNERNPYGSSSSKARPAGSTSRASIYRQTNHSDETIRTQLPAYRSTSTLVPSYEESQSAQPAQSSRRDPREVGNGKPSRRHEYTGGTEKREKQ